MSKKTNSIEIEAASAEGLATAVAQASREPIRGSEGLDDLLQKLKARPLPQGRSLMTDEDVEALAIRGRFEDRRRQALDPAQAVVDALRHSGIPTLCIYLVKENMLGQKQVEAAFAVAVKPEERIAVLAPVPIAGNAKMLEVAHMRRLSAATVLKLRYCDGWQVFILSTEGKLKDSQVLAPLGVRFENIMSAKNMVELMASLGAAVKVGLPAPADKALKLPREGGDTYVTGLVRVVKRLLPHGRIKAEVELDLNSTLDSELGRGLIRS